MSQNNDKEFENLFKRAADQYPLSARNGDWDAVLNKLEEDEEEKPFLFRKKTILTILLLLAVGLISSLITGLIVWKSAHKNTSTQTSKQIIKEGGEASRQNKEIADEVYNKVMNDLKNNKQSIKINSTGKDSISNTLKVQHQNLPVNTNVAAIPINKSVYAKKPATGIEKNNSLVRDLSSQQHQDVKNTNTKNVEATTKEAITTQKDRPNSTGINADSISNVQQSNTTLNINPVNTKTEASNKTEAGITLSKANTKPVIQKPASGKYFYTGLMYAKDKSSVQFEQNKGAGYSWAILLGYRFSKRLSLETGVHIEKKEYFTTGAHFNKEILAATGNILWIESENKLMEIPLTLKVDLLNKRKHNLFTTIGLSSYIVNHEHYEYEEEVGGVIQNETVVFSNNTSNIFSTLNFSLGYQFKFGAFGHLRLEPYLNLPIGVIGKSKTPVISRGLYIGWTYDFHKNMLKQ